MRSPATRIGGPQALVRCNYSLARPSYDTDRSRRPDIDHRASTLARHAAAQARCEQPDESIAISLADARETGSLHRRVGRNLMRRSRCSCLPCGGPAHSARCEMGSLSMNSPALSARCSERHAYEELQPHSLSFDVGDVLTLSSQTYLSPAKHATSLPISDSTPGVRSTIV